MNSAARGKIQQRSPLLVSGLILITVLATSLFWNGSSSQLRGAAAEGIGMAYYGTPIQNGIAGPDSPTSFNATLPNGRRITPAGTSVQVGENPLGAALSPDGKYLVVSNDDERNGKAVNTKYSQAALNGAGKVPGGFVIATVRTSDMQVVDSAVAPTNTTVHPGPKAPGLSQSDKTNGLFLGVAVKANAGGNATVYASGGYSNLVHVYALGSDGKLTLTTSISVPVPTDPTKPNFGMAFPGGLTLSADGSQLYVVNNNANNVVTIDTATNSVVGQPAPVGYFPYGAQIAPDGSKLYVTNWGLSDRSFNSTYTGSFDSTTNTGTGSPFIGGVPGNLFANPKTNDAYSSSVSIVPLGGARRSVGSISVSRQPDGVNLVGGPHPSAMAVATGGGRSVLYVANANEDSLALVDANSDNYLGKVYLPQIVGASGDTQSGDSRNQKGQGRVFGLTPDALAVSPDNTRLYVAEAALNSVAVYDITNPANPRFLGRIPTGWYPTALNISSDGSSLYVTNAKGVGSDFGFQGMVNGAPDVNLLFGTVQKVDLTSLDLASTTPQVLQNTVQTMDNSSYQTLAAVGKHIQHVIYILRENKSYDSYLGNDSVLNSRGANGKPAYAMYDSQVPNTKALAEAFAVGDNAYADSEESNAGHQFALAGGTTDYMQKTLLERFNRPFLNIKNSDPEDYPLRGYLFNNAQRSGVSYRDYGDMVRISGYDDGKNPDPCADDPYPGCTKDTYSYKNTTLPTSGLGGLYAENVPGLAALGNGHIDPQYPGWNLNISDQRRVNEFKRDMGNAITAGQVPAFTFVWLPTDHTGNGLDPKFQVSDNDAALGQLVDYVSHSSIWANTAIFVTEDDAQGTADHVNAHRTYTMVISPWAKRATVIHRLSSTVSIPKTIEELLGMPSMNLGDLITNDLSDYFTNTPDFTPYTALPQAYGSPVTAQEARIMKLTRTLDASSYDRDNGRLGKINYLYYLSTKLTLRRASMTPEAYRAAQDRLYRAALAVANQKNANISIHASTFSTGSKAKLHVTH